MLTLFELKCLVTHSGYIYLKYLKIVSIQANNGEMFAIFLLTNRNIVLLSKHSSWLEHFTQGILHAPLKVANFHLHGEVIQINHY